MSEKIYLLSLKLYKKTKTVKTTFESVFYQFVEHKK